MVTPFLPGLESGASTPTSIIQHRSLSPLEGSDCESLDDASVSWFPGITRTNMELPLLLLLSSRLLILASLLTLLLMLQLNE